MASLYIMLGISAVLLAANFALTKVYQAREGSSFKKGLLYNAVVGFATAAIFFAISGFRFRITLFSLLMATLQTVCGALYTLIGLKIMARATVSDYTFFLMTGGMIVPYIWGLAFLGEELRAWNLIGLAMITVSLFLKNGVSKKGVGVTVMCVAIFFLNGMVSVTSKLHQLDANAALAVPSESYVMLAALVNGVLNLAITFFVPTRGEKMRISGRSVVYMLAIALIGGVSYLLQLKGAALPATVCYPIITGGSIVFTGIAGAVFFRERIGVRSAVAMATALAGTCMFL